MAEIYQKRVEQIMQTYLHNIKNCNQGPEKKLWNIEQQNDDICSVTESRGVCEITGQTTSGETTG